MLEPVELRCDVTIEMNVFARGIAALFAILALVVLGGCESTRGGSIPYERADFGVPDAPSKSVPLNVDYRIAPLDTLAITVYQEEDLTKEVQVDLRGSIGMPMVGSMRAVDLTTAQLEEQLETQYRRFIKNPDVSVAIKSSTRSNVTVDGSVQSPGVFPVTGPTTLIQAIAMAKGTTEAANPRRVAVFRQTGGKQLAAAFDLTSIRRGEAKDPVIYAGDIIVVDGSNIKAAQKSILQTIPLLAIFGPF